MTMTLNAAAKACGRAKGTILKAIRDGDMSAPKDEKGRYKIDPSELNRVFPFSVSETGSDQFEKPSLTTPSDHENHIEIERLKAALEAEQRVTESLNGQVDDLRKRLDQESEERRTLTRMLTDQRERPQEATQSRPRGFLGLFGGRGRANA